MSFDNSRQLSQPLFLLSDSQLLFWKLQNSLFLHCARGLCEETAIAWGEPITSSNPIRAAYIGASNGDVPEYFEIFQAAMEGIGISDCRFISRHLSESDIAHLKSAHLILLAGGDPWLGWQTVRQLKGLLQEAHARGVVLIGVSAGAIQLGQLGWRTLIPRSGSDLFSTLQLAKVIVGVHEESQQWQTLKQVMRLTDGLILGIGIPLGGGVMVYPSGEISVLRKPVVRFSGEKGEVVDTIFPHIG